MKYFSNSGIGQDRHELNSNPAMETVALLETVEKQTAVFHRFHSAWKTLQKAVEFSTVPTAATASQ
jgi:hypothetical protein